MQAAGGVWNCGARGRVGQSATLVRQRTVNGASTRVTVPVCAVPKKKKAKRQTRNKRARWYEEANQEAERALSLAKSVLSGKSTSFLYPSKVQ